MSPLIVMLLASAGPLLVGFVGMGDDDTDPEAAEADGIIDDPSDPVETVDVATFLEAARTMSDNAEAVAASRGTDADAVFVADAGTPVAHDASGGADDLTGSDGADTLIGGDGGDVIRGGDGDDALFSGFARQDRADDADVDTLFGQDGDDALFLGGGDTGSGGAGSDVFATLVDAGETVTIADFDPAEDALAIETTDPDSASVLDQRVEESGLNVSLSTGLTLVLVGIDAPLAEDIFQFVRADPIAEA